MIKWRHLYAFIKKIYKRNEVYLERLHFRKLIKMNEVKVDISVNVVR